MLISEVVLLVVVLAVVILIVVVVLVLGVKFLPVGAVGNEVGGVTALKVAPG
jgi:hypothetical protein